MAISCDPADLVSASECYRDKIPQGDRDGVIIYLLNVISELNYTPEQLEAAAACFTQKIDKHTQGAIIAYLLCQIVNK